VIAQRRRSTTPAPFVGSRMANERDAEGHMICPVCREVIGDPGRSPFMGDERVHEKCWSPPIKPSNP
jgi:hypothetical protein